MMDYVCNQVMNKGERQEKLLETQSEGKRNKVEVVEKEKKEQNCGQNEDIITKEIEENLKHLDKVENFNNEKEENEMVAENNQIEAEDKTLHMLSIPKEDEEIEEQNRTAAWEIDLKEQEQNEMEAQNKNREEEQRNKEKESELGVKSGNKNNSGNENLHSQQCHTEEKTNEQIDLLQEMEVQDEDSTIPGAISNQHILHKAEKQNNSNENKASEPLNRREGTELFSSVNQPHGDNLVEEEKITERNKSPAEENNSISLPHKTQDPFLLDKQLVSKLATAEETLNNTSTQQELHHRLKESLHEESKEYSIQSHEGEAAVTVLTNPRDKLDTLDEPEQVLSPIIGVTGPLDKQNIQGALGNMFPDVQEEQTFFARNHKIAMSGTIVSFKDAKNESDAEEEMKEERFSRNSQRSCGEKSVKSANSQGNQNTEEPRVLFSNEIDPQQEQEEKVVIFDDFTDLKHQNPLYLQKQEGVKGEESVIECAEDFQLQEDSDQEHKNKLNDL